MFHNFILKAKETPKAVNISGMALTTVSVSPYFEPKLSVNIIEYTSSGFCPVRERKIPPNNRARNTETSGMIKTITGEGVKRFSSLNLSRSIVVHPFSGRAGACH